LAEPGTDRRAVAASGDIGQGCDEFFVFVERGGQERWT
jgi:hypothetical protein